MARNENVINVLLLAAIAAIGAGYFVPRYISAIPLPTAATAVTKPAPSAQPSPTTTSQASPQPNSTPVPQSQWLVAAPGRVEPTGGEIRMSAQSPGRIVEVLVGINDTVREGDLLVRTDDTDATARVHAAEAEVSVRRAERNGENVTGVARERRNAEDGVANAERVVVTTRAELDRLERARTTATPPADADIEKARDALVAANERLEATRATLRKVLSGDNLPAQTRFEAAVAVARTDLRLADAALERTRIRAPRNGKVLQLAATVGETAQPTVEQILLVLGDVSKLRVRAEIEERDVAKVKTGQAVVVRSDAYPGQSFDGAIASRGQSLSPGKIALKGPRRGTEVDVLEIMIDLAGNPPLLPGMRVDVFVKPDPVKAQ